MKSLSILGACALLAATAMAADGTIDVRNRNTGAGIDAPIFDVGGATKLDGPNYVAQIFAGPVGGSLTAFGSKMPFRTGTGAGYYNYGADPTLTLTGLAAGADAQVQVRVWESQYADFAAAQAAGGKYGSSAILTLKTGNAGTPPTLPTALTGLTSFSLAGGVIPEPSTIALGLLGATVLMLRRRK